MGAALTASVAPSRSRPSVAGSLWPGAPGHRGAGGSVGVSFSPGSRGEEDELAGGVLPEGEWWVVDTAEGNINHIHGMGEWAVTATLVRDNVPVLSVVHLPLTGDTYTALQGKGGVPQRRAAARLRPARGNRLPHGRRSGNAAFRRRGIALVESS